MSTDTETGQRRRRVRLTSMRSIPVEFTGERAGEGPLTLGQRDVYTWTSSTPDHPYAILYAEFPVPAVVSVDDVAGAAAALIARHESLRTTYVPGEQPGEQPRQRGAGSGVQLLEVCSLGAGGGGRALAPRAGAIRSPRPPPRSRTGPGPTARSWPKRAPPPPCPAPCR